LERGSVSRVFLRQRDSALVGETGAKNLALTSFGTEAERRWLLEALRASLGIEEPASAGAPDAAADGVAQRPAEAPKGWLVDVAPDGSTRIAQTPSARLAAAGVLF